MKQLTILAAALCFAQAGFAQGTAGTQEYSPINGTPIIIQQTAPAEAAGNAQPQGYRENPNRAWQDGTLQEFPPTIGAGQLDDPSLTLIQGTVIDAIFTGAVSSELPGSVRATTSRTIYSMDGTRVLIPRGSSLYGEYRADTQLAQTRLAIVWSRVITPDGITAQIASSVTDSQGRAGGTGHVDTHFGQRFGSAALISFLGVAPVALVSDNDNSAQTQLANNVGSDLQDATSSVVGDYLSITPTIHIDQGTRISAILQRDVVFDGF